MFIFFSTGLGGVFLLRNGKIKQHVMRDFSETPINTESELMNWFKFYEMPAPMIAVGTLVTNEAVSCTANCNEIVLHINLMC